MGREIFIAQCACFKLATKQYRCCSTKALANFIGVGVDVFMLGSMPSFDQRDQTPQGFKDLDAGFLWGIEPEVVELIPLLIFNPAASRS